jgi:hypothetical protein
MAAGPSHSEHDGQASYGFPAFRSRFPPPCLARLLPFFQIMKTILFPIIAALGVVVTLGHSTTMRAKGNTLQPAGNNLIAIDVLLEPDRTMVVKANALNDRLRGDYPAGYSLDATHAPHVSMLQRFVRAADLGAVTAAVAKVLTAERPTDLH